MVIDRAFPDRTPELAARCLFVECVNASRAGAKGAAPTDHERERRFASSVCANTANDGGRENERTFQPEHNIPGVARRASGKAYSRIWTADRAWRVLANGNAMSGSRGIREKGGMKRCHCLG